MHRSSELGLNTPCAIGLAACGADSRLIALIINKNRLFVVAAIEDLLDGRCCCVVCCRGLVDGLNRLLIHGRRSNDIAVNAGLWVLPANGLVYRRTGQGLLRRLLCERVVLSS